MLSDKESKAIRLIRNELMHNGQTLTVRKLSKSLGFSSPRTGALIISQLVEKGYLRRKSKRELQIVKQTEGPDTSAQTVDVPFVGTIACGTPLLAVENIEMKIPVSVKIAKPPYRYFFLKASGNSMNKVGIENGNMILIRQQSTANNGDFVVALIDDEATLKEFHSFNDHIVLKPRSTSKEYNPIILTKDFKIQGVVIKNYPSFIGN
ncbi:MAG: repressor LexA [Elusimicrobia bacterium RIFOXYB2_FULL_48_7]|nr:MAG: repressor LexA [Elusimicrobia bacterium RIFOXYB2_FULL_48_7]